MTAPEDRPAPGSRLPEPDPFPKLLWAPPGASANLPPIEVVPPPPG